MLSCWISCSLVAASSTKKFLEPSVCEIEKISASQNFPLYSVYYSSCLYCLKNDLYMYSTTQIFNSHKLPQGKLGDYCDGSQFQQHPLFQKDPCALQIHFYYDDVEVCNPLGSKAVIHKVGKWLFQWRINTKPVLSVLLLHLEDLLEDGLFIDPLDGQFCQYIYYQKHIPLSPTPLKIGVLLSSCCKPII